MMEQYSTLMELGIDTCHNMGDPGKHHTEGKNPRHKGPRIV